MVLVVQQELLVPPAPRDRWACSAVRASLAKLGNEDSLVRMVSVDLMDVRDTQVSPDPLDSWVTLDPRDPLELQDSLDGLV